MSRTEFPLPAAINPSSSGAPSPPSLLRILEAMLFLGGDPLTSERACAAIRNLTAAQFEESVAELSAEYRHQGRPYVIQATENGYALTLRSRFQPVVERLSGGQRAARLSPAALDVLALVAYRQPATRAEIDTLRGADCGSLLRQLLRRGLVAVVHRGDAEHREWTYGTTARFLEQFKLRSLDDLPQTEELQKM
jgi:segregation and condensation protein B